MERKLVTFRRVNEITPIADADAIELARIDGWQCVVKKGEFKVGDIGVYFEIDSWIPLAPEGADPEEGSAEALFAKFEFLQNKKQVWQGKTGFRVKTIRLRGVLSQGWLVPCQLLNVNPDLFSASCDLTDLFDVDKWELPIPAQLAGQVRGNFPTWGRKTDAERVQNISDEVLESLMDEEFEVTVKRDGSSCSMWHRQGDVGVCSRNLDLKLEDEENTFVKMFNAVDAGVILPALAQDVMVQGEVFGPGIQSNFEKVKDFTYEVFNIFDVQHAYYFTREERLSLIAAYNAIAGEELIKNVPTIFVGKLRDFADTREKLIASADGPSAGDGKFREGLVFKSCRRINGDIFIFKVVSNKYLEKTGN
jgi:RNA ligase (TIGR02306 family)